MTERVRVGQVAGSFGVEGALKIYPLTDFADRFAPGSELWLGEDTHRVEWSRTRPAGVVVKLSGIDDRTLAQLQRGRYLEVPEERVHKLPEDHYYHRQLVGLEVETAGGHKLGRITDVLEKPANDVWVSTGSGGEHLIPATRDAVLDVRLEEGRVVVADWLLRVEDA